MKARTILLALAFCLAGAVACFAADANLGKWKLNDAKSKIPAGVAKNNEVTYTADGDKFKCVVNGVDAAGKPTHNEWTGKFDGKDYPVTGDANADTRSVKIIDAHHYEIDNKKGGKVVLSGKVEISADGKTRTLTTHQKDAAGKDVTSVTVFDKQ